MKMISEVKDAGKKLEGDKDRLDSCLFSCL